MAFSLGPRASSAGYRLAAFDRIGSTNAEAMARARDGERGPMWFVTSEQTAGRGRRRRPWIAPRGNLASSILEVVDVSPAVAATLGFAAGVALEAGPQKGSWGASLRVAGEAGGNAAGGGDRGRRVAGGRGRHRHQRHRGAGRHANASDLAGNAGRPCRRGGIICHILRRLGRIPRHLGQRPWLWRDPTALAGARCRAWRAGRDPGRRLYRGRDI